VVPYVILLHAVRKGSRLLADFLLRHRPAANFVFQHLVVIQSFVYFSIIGHNFVGLLVASLHLLYCFLVGRLECPQVGFLFLLQCNDSFLTQLEMFLQRGVFQLHLEQLAVIL